MRCSLYGAWLRRERRSGKRNIAATVLVVTPTVLTLLASGVGGALYTGGFLRAAQQPSFVHALPQAELGLWQASASLITDQASGPWTGGNVAIRLEGQRYPLPVAATVGIGPDGAADLAHHPASVLQDRIVGQFSASDRPCDRRCVLHIGVEMADGERFATMVALSEANVPGIALPVVGDLSAGQWIVLLFFAASLIFPLAAWTVLIFRQ